MSAPRESWRHCPRCGAPLAPRALGGRERPACACGLVDWANPVPAAAVMLLRGAAPSWELLWVRRAHAPKLGLWSLPSGFQEWEEDIADCARRELAEETGLAAPLGPLVGVYSAFDDPRHNALLVVYRAEFAGGEARAGDDADAIAWHPLAAPPAIAWDSHRRALADLRAQLGALD
ncbi:NUDIX domain-containing protein [bacterium]|nr:NUDIX domain-containing protein [bacterium]